MSATEILTHFAASLPQEYVSICASAEDGPSAREECLAWSHQFTREQKIMLIKSLEKLLEE